VPFSSLSSRSAILSLTLKTRRHMTKRSRFAEEYEDFLRRFEISYDKKYVLEEIN
jgi:hypothetical protein